MSREKRLRVLQVALPPQQGGNPYVALLMDGMPADVETHFFTWRRGLAADYDVLHIHWPERFYRHRRFLARWLKRILFLVILWRLGRRGGSVVQTIHNPEPHEPGDLFEGKLLARLARMTSGWIRLNDDTPAPGSGTVATIPHGHYRDLYSSAPCVEPTEGLVLFFGRIRPYKGVEALLGAVKELDSRDIRLRIAGAPLTEAYGRSIRDMAGGDPRVSLRLERIPEDELALEIRRAQLVALPYREMHNSGVVLLALSLDRPVLVPDNRVTSSLRSEFGKEWVITFDDGMSSEDLVRGLNEAKRAIGGRPPLSQREWGPIAAATASVYRQALSGEPGMKQEAAEVEQGRQWQ